MKRIKKIGVILAILGSIVLCINWFYNKLFTTPIDLKPSEIGKIFIAVELTSTEEPLRGGATVTDNDNLKDVVNILNNIKVFKKGKYSLYDLEGESPTAWIHIYNKAGEVIDTIDIYYDILAYKVKYYKISMSEYNSLMEICQKYGEIIPSSVG